ncbi:MAG: hypothetical protein ACQES9_10230 [Myxococcota bacterium]
MIKKFSIITVAIFILCGCQKSEESCSQESEQKKNQKAVNDTSRRNSRKHKTGKKDTKKQTIKDKTIKNKTIKEITSFLLKKHSQSESFRIKRGVKQTAALWRINKDGNAEKFKKFCLENFLPDGDKLDKLFSRLQRNLEIIKGNGTQIKIRLQEPVHVAMGEKLEIDKLFAAYSPLAHFAEDMYKSGIGFIVTLNFPSFSLEEKNKQGVEWTRKQWAYARMGDIFTARIPAEVKQEISRAMTEADDYISNYNIYMGKLVDEKFKTWFPEKMKLITHWNLRDELKSRYADKKHGLYRQKIIYQVMKRIIDQSIPQKVIDNPDYQWNPFANKVYKNKKLIQAKAEPNTRYQYFLDNFKARKAVDHYSPQYPTYISRAFNRDLEYSFAEIEKLFISLVSSPQVKKTAALIKARLGRDLEPFDIWYDGFKTRGTIPESKLDELTRSKFPNPEALYKHLPGFLEQLGFTPEKSRKIVEKIKVDPSRGAGHAYGSEMKSAKSRLRTRFGEKGMDYKGYNIAVHEFGHNVEQTLTLHDVDNYLMHGVPNTAFTEAWAFIFQKRDLELLGIKDDNPLKKHLRGLDNFWSSYEIMGVSLVDMYVWKWLYENPGVDSSKLKKAVIRIAKEVWNKYYAGVFGKKDEPVLAIYSHMIDYPLYLPAYPIGHLAEFQIEKHISGKNLGSEMLRICSQGRLTPDLWMNKAVGNKLSVKSTLKAVDAALSNSEFKISR